MLVHIYGHVRYLIKIRKIYEPVYIGSNKAVKNDKNYKVIYIRKRVNKLKEYLYR